MRWILPVSVYLGMAPVAIAGISPQLQPLAISGQPTPDGSVYSSFGPAYMGPDGTVAFQSMFTGVLAWNLVVERGQTVNVVAHSGHIAPGTSTGFGTVTSMSISRTGEVAFTSDLNGGSSGAWSNTSAATSLIARAGGTLPGGQTIHWPLDGVFANGGQYAIFPSTSTTNSLPSGIWAGPVGGLQTVATVGALAPGWDDSGRFTSFSRLRTFSASGQMAFTAVAKGQSASIGYPGLWAGPISAPQLIGRSQYPAPGGGVFYDFGSPAMNSSGQLAFTATLNGSTSDNAMFFGTPDSMSRIVRVGDAAPGSGSAFSSFNRPQLTDAGDLFFLGSTSLSSGGIWRYSSSGLSLVLLQGEAAPDLPGLVLGNLGATAFNDHGQCVFSANLSGPGVDSTNNSGIFYTDWNDPSTQHLLLRLGSTIEVSPGVSKTVSLCSLNTDNGEFEGWVQNLSNGGQAVMTLGFTDGTSGVFLATIPTPATLSVLLLFGFTRRPRRA